MTIALGLIARDGVVIAADRQSTEGEHKKAQRKIESLWALQVGALLVSGAGTASYIETMTERLRFCFGTTQSKDSSKGMTDEFRSYILPSILKPCSPLLRTRPKKGQRWVSA